MFDELLLSVTLQPNESVRRECLVEFAVLISVFDRSVELTPTVSFWLSRQFCVTLNVLYF